MQKTESKLGYTAQARVYSLVFDEAYEKVYADLSVNIE
jgi:hypothetical protein